MATFRAAAVGLFVMAILISLPFSADQMDQVYSETFLLIFLVVILLEGLIMGRMIFFGAVPQFCIAIFLALLAGSYFMSDLHKYHTSPDTLDRFLWCVVLYVTYLAVSQTRSGLRLIQCGILIALAILLRRTPVTGRDDILAYAVSAFAACAGLAWAKFYRPSGPPSGLPAQTAGIILTAMLLFGVWGALTAGRMNVGEIELVQKNRQTDHALLSAARSTWREQKLLGAGPGSISKKFMQHRPPEATIRGVPERIPGMSQTMAVILAEQGTLGLAAVLVLLVCPFWAPMSSGTTWDRAFILGVYGFVVARDVCGGGWLLTPAGSLICFSVLGMRLGLVQGTGAKQLPASFFVLTLSLAGGLILLQQIYFWKSLQIDHLVRNMKLAIQEDRIDDAVYTGNDILFHDPHRNDVISLMVGVLSRSKQTQRALENSLTLLERDPYYPAVNNNIGTLYMILSKPDDAVPYIRATAESHPTTENLTRLGHLCVLTGRIDDAQRAFESAAHLFLREVPIFLTWASFDPDRLKEGGTLLEAGNFSMNFLVEYATNGRPVAGLQPLIESYRKASADLKTAIGKDPGS